MTRFSLSKAIKPSLALISLALFGCASDAEMQAHYAARKDLSYTTGSNIPKKDTDAVTVSGIALQKVRDASVDIAPIKADPRPN
jgi:outer membrane lipoprotein-sorting protein